MDSSGDFGPSACVFKRAIVSSVSPSARPGPFFLAGEFRHQRLRSRKHIAACIFARFSRLHAPPARAPVLRETNNQSNAHSAFRFKFSTKFCTTRDSLIHFVVPSAACAPTPRASAADARIHTTTYRFANHIVVAFVVVVPFVISSVRFISVAAEAWRTQSNSTSPDVSLSLSVCARAVTDRRTRSLS